jgi:DNA-binding Lrp family transcriptional regulator
MEAKHLEEIDKNILDILSHYGSLSLQDLWYELGENRDLKEQPVTWDAVLNRLEFLSTIGFVKSEGDEWIIRK